MAKAVKIAIAMDRQVLQQVDAAARRRSVSRSRLITDAVRAVLRARAARDITRRVDEVFGDPGTRAAQRQEGEELLRGVLWSREEEEW